MPMFLMKGGGSDLRKRRLGKEKLLDEILNIPHLVRPKISTQRSLGPNVLLPCFAQHSSAVDDGKLSCQMAIPR